MSKDWPFMKRVSQMKSCCCCNRIGHHHHSICPNDQALTTLSSERGQPQPLIATSETGVEPTQM